MSANLGGPKLGEILDQVHALVSDERGGEVASYIPALARAAPEDFGLAIVTTGGDVYTSGESETEFTIQSVSKPFTLALALDRCGLESTYRASVQNRRVTPSTRWFSTLRRTSPSTR
jgi:glutaminase